MPHEHARRLALQPPERRERAPRPVGVGQEGGHRHVEVAVAVEVGGKGAVGAGQRGEVVRLEGERAAVLQPADAVPGLDGRVVERRAVRHQHVEVAVTVEVHEVDPGRAPGRRARREHGPLLELSPSPRPKKADDGLVLLRRGAPRSPAARRRRGRRSARGSRPAARRGVVATNRGSFQSVVRFSRSRIPPRVYSPKAATTRSRSPSPSKSAASTSVTRGSFSARTRFSKVPSPAAAQPHHAALLVVLGHEEADVGDQQVRMPSRSRSAAAAWAGFGTLAISRSSPGRLTGSPVEHEPVAHVAGHDLEPAVTVEVEEARVRDDRHRRGAGRAQQAALEALRSGRGPRRPEVATPRARAPRSRRRRARGRACESALAPRRHADARQAEARHVLQARPPEPARHVAGAGRTWHAAHSLRTMSTNAASGRGSGWPSRPEGRRGRRGSRRRSLGP